MHTRIVLFPLIVLAAAAYQPCMGEDSVEAAEKAYLAGVQKADA